MNTYLISSKNQELATTQVDKIIKENNIDVFDIEIFELEKALGIEDVRNIQKKIFLKPFKGSLKATILRLLNGATIEAQNSMLKLLEEPPNSSVIIIVTDNYLALLPTVLSRLKIIEVKNDEFDKNLDVINQVLSLDGEGDCLQLAQKISKEKNDAIIFLEKAILGAREIMIENLEDKKESLKLRRLIHKIELTHYDLKSTNANPRLALENLFLNISV